MQTANAPVINPVAFAAEFLWCRMAATKIVAVPGKVLMNLPAMPLRAVAMIANAMLLMMLAPLLPGLTMSATRSFSL